MKREEELQSYLSQVVLLAKNEMAEVALKLDSEPAALTWSEPIRSLGVHILKSTCGRFSIHAEKVGGRWRYEALVRTDIWNNMLGVCGSKDEAIALCEARAGETA